MKKNNRMIFLAAILVFSLGGCAQREEMIVQEPEWAAAGPAWDSESGAEPGDAKGPAGEEAVRTGETESSMPALEGMIPEQSFETELDGWGKVFFVSLTPNGGSQRPEFLLIKEGETVYTFPEASQEPAGRFTAVSAVAFQDYNGDGKKDVLVLASYGDGERQWNEPLIFLQENSDNMFYLDHPGLEDYRIEEKAQEGPSFYRDAFLEEYLSAQRRTGSIAELSGSWAGYVDYADSLSGILSVERQIQIFAQNRESWSQGMDYANDRHCFTLAGLCNDGRLVLIVSSQGGTGNYTYSEFYKISEEGALQKLETSFREGDSPPDLIMESMSVYSSFSREGILNHFIVHDEMKDSPGSYFNRISSLTVSNDYVLETPLATRAVIYEEQDGKISERASSQDCNGNALTQEEYESFPDLYYGNMGLTKQTAVFKWMDVGSLAGMSQEEAEEALKEAYEGFSMK